MGATIIQIIGTSSGLLFIIQLFCQIKYYGIKVWVREGMGVGVDRAIAKAEVKADLE